MGSQLRSGLILLALLAIAGCEGRPTRYKVSGQVLIDGKPLPAGQMIVMPDNARRATAILDENGRFTLTTYDQDGQGDGVVPGTHKVGITAFENVGPNKLKWHAPKKYIDPETSGLTLSVTQDTNDAVINLTWNGGAPFFESAGGDTAPVTP
jgi:hypothetical protein